MDPFIVHRTGVAFWHYPDGTELALIAGAEDEGTEGEGGDGGAAEGEGEGEGEGEAGDGGAGESGGAKPSAKPKPQAKPKGKTEPPVDADSKIAELSKQVSTLTDLVGTIKIKSSGTGGNEGGGISADALASAVRKALDDDSHAAAHRRMAEREASRKPRGNVAKLMFGMLGRDRE